MASSTHASASVAEPRALDARRVGGAVFRVVRRYPFPCLVTLVLFLIGAGSGLADFIAPYDPNAINPSDRLQGPNSTYWMGTDALGRDVFTRVLYGGRASLGVSVTSVALGVVIATAVGLVSGALGGWFDVLVQRIVDMLMAFPGLIIVISLTAFFGTSVSLLVVVIAIALLGGGIRISRAAAIQVGSQPYIEAARTIGATTPRIIVRHILPNALPPIMVIATAYLGVAILIEASVSFLGYGIQPPAASWGFMLGAEARIHMIEQPWLSVWPGLAIFLTVFSFNIIGDALRDAFDPRLRGSG
ncbi:MAG: ABC transporter permease [Chloroflexi bacterium]|nr:ABC transporter permease [Chloroflexota bacterium]MYG90829.1 ABC transporter permease [Chloroflexota bacterium]MYJ92119.1 ABC transporter permease [Chloroflexota bacterium]